MSIYGLNPVAAITSRLALMATCLLLLLPWQPAWALSALDLPSQPPQERVLDQAAVLSRATTAELQRRLEGLSAAGLTAHLVTVRNLDYGLSGEALARQLAERWQPEPGPETGELVLLIDAQSNTAAIAVSAGLEDRLNATLLRSTVNATMGPTLRDGGRYRQASLDALERLSVVLAGGEDPGVPEIADVAAVVTNIPSREQTASSHALRWVIVLLVVGSVVPMVTWWVFSR